MASISRYDSPAQSQFVNTYVPIPFNEMVQAGQVMQRQYETGMDALQQVYDDTYNIKYIPGSMDEQYVKSSVIPATKQVFEKYIQMDMGDPVVRRQAIMDLNSKIDKQKINKIQESHAGWVDNQKWRQKLQAEGKYADYLDTPDEGYNTDVQGVYNKLTPAKMDYRQEAEQYFNNLRPDSRIVGNQVVGIIDEKKLQKTARGNVQSFLDSTAGSQKLIEYRKRTGDYDSRPEDIAYNYLLEVGKEKLTREHQGFVPEYMTAGSKTKPTTSEYFRVERTPIINLKERKVKSSDFDPKTSRQRGDLPSFSSMGVTLLDNTSKDRNKPFTYLDKAPLFEKEVKNLVNILPQEAKEQYDQLTRGNLSYTNPDEYKRIQKEFYGKLKNTYSQLENDLQQGSYLNAYYPDEIQGIPESRLNNVDTQTKYIFRTNKLKELSAGQFANREFIDPESGKSYNGKEFYDDIVKEELNDNEEGNIAVTGNYHYENPFVALTNNDNFSNSYQISVNGKQYVMSGSAGDYTDPLYRYKANANRSYTLVKYNPGIQIDENDGTVKLYQDGIFNIADKSTGNIIGQSNQFEEAFNQARQYYSSKQQR